MHIKSGDFNQWKFVRPSIYRRYNTSTLCSRRISCPMIKAESSKSTWHAVSSNSSTMGRIRDAFRRKRSAPSTPTSLSSPCTSPMNINGSISMEDEIDKENSCIGENMTNALNNALQLSKCEIIIDVRQDESCIEVTLSDSEPESEIVDDSKRDDDSLQQTIPQSNDTHSYDECNGDNEQAREDIVERNERNIEFPVEEKTDLVAVGSNSELTSLSNDLSSSEISEHSDDGVLRDDEGNAIDLNEVEANMLRDDEGNIIDPKTLVVRDFLLDLSCESDEYYDDSGEHINPKELISCIGNSQDLTSQVTDSTTHSEGEADSDTEIQIRPLHEEVVLPSHQNIIKECKLESNLACSKQKVEKYEDLETKGKRINYSRRRSRRHKRSIPEGSNEFIHIMFNNRLTTLDEESLSSHHHEGDSGDDADDELHAASPRSRQRSPRLRNGGSFDEKFIQARWEYSLQVMNSGMMDGVAVIGVARGAIDFEEETGEI